MYQTKSCGKCHQLKSIDEFHWDDASHTRKRFECKECGKAKVRALYASKPEMRKRVSEKSTQWANDNPEQHKRHARTVHLRRDYGMNGLDYDNLLTAQGGKCALCGVESVGRYGKDAKWKAGRWMIDHCHRTGRVRGLLCHKCNVRLGAYEGLMELVGEARLTSYLSSGIDYFKLNGIVPRKPAKFRRKVLE
jgi:hypothetical protein